MQGKLRQWREMKREEAKERQNAWAVQTPQQQIKELDRRLGKGLGAKKQRAKIARQMED